MNGPTDAVSELHGDVRIVGDEVRPQAHSLPGGQQLCPGGSRPVDPLERITATAACGEFIGD